MAVSNLSAIQSALSLIFDNQLSRQWNRVSRTLSLTRAMPLGGKSVNWSISTSGQTANTHTEGADITSGELLIDAKKDMVLGWGLYRNAIGLSSLSLEVAAGSSGSALEMMSLLEEEVSGAGHALASKLNLDLFSGDGTSNALVGFDNALITTGTYGTQDVSTVTSLKSNLDANGGTPRALTIALMEEMETAIYTRCAESPTVIVTTPAIFAKYKGLFEPVRRVVGDHPGAYDTSVKDDAVYFMGIPIIRDINATAGSMYFLNERLMEMKYVRPMFFGDSVTSVIRKAMGSNGLSQQDPTSIPLRLESLAKTGDSNKFFLRTVCQLCIKRPNAFGILSDLAS